MPTSKDVLSVYLDEEVKKELERWADEEDRSMSYLAARIIKKAIDERRQRKDEKGSP